MRAILFLGLVLIVFFAIRYLINSFKTLQATTRPGSDDSAPDNNSQQPEQMVACEKCQLHFPVSQAITQDGKHFCSQQHLEDFSRK